MNIVRANKNDIDEIYNIEKDIYIDPWTKNQYIDDICNNKFSYYYLLKDNGKVIGYYGIWIVSDYATITKVSISKKHQGKGLSKILMNDLINKCIENNCDCIDLEVRVSNIAAINLYKNFEFEIVNIRKEYYSNKEDALLMVKKIKGVDSYERIHISA